MPVNINGNGTLSGIDLTSSNLGKILQVVQSVKTDTFSESVATGGVSADCISASITPSLSTSKVFVIVQYSASTTTSGHFSYLYRNGSPSEFRGDAAGSRVRVSTGGSGSGAQTAAGTYNGVIMYLDSPATTSSTTYSLRLGHVSSGTSTVYLNRSETDSDAATHPRSASSIILVEVAA